MKKILLLLLTIIFFGNIYAQSTFTVSGTIRDAKTGEPMFGAIITVMEISGTGEIGDEKGNFSLRLQKGKYTLIAGYMGYLDDTININVDADKSFVIHLNALENKIDEVVVYANAVNENIISAQTGIEKLDIKALNKLPVIFGERDILKSMQLMPGIKSAGEGSSGLNVRGGGDNENLILLDGATVYNASHLLGFFSIFNSDAISDAAIYKGTQPVQYGGRLSSVIDVKTKIGDYKKFSASGSIGLISSKISVEGPIAKNKASFFISARRTYADVFLKASKDAGIRNNKLYFYDFNAKINYMIGKKDAISVSGYYGRDKLGFAKSFGMGWGNSIATLRWNHIINESSFSSLSAIFSNYDYKIDLQNGDNTYKIRSSIRDYNLKEEIEYTAKTHVLRFGFNSVFHNILPGKVSSFTDSTHYDASLQRRYSWENAVYAGDEWKVNSWMNINYGIRLASFSVLGNGDFYNLNPTGEVASTTTYKKGQFVKTYLHVEPRLSASFVINKDISIKTSYDRNTQDLHLISNSTSTNPTDKWIPSNNNIKPAIADQVSLGYFQNIHHSMFELSVEGYYKHMQNIIDYKDGANVLYNDAIETQLLKGAGRAYGVEFMFRKKKGKLTGWVAYTYSRTEKKINGINNSNWYPARQDRTHDVSIAVIYDVTKKINLSATWVYNTGNAVTFPSGKYELDGQAVPLYSERNGYRMPSYHRLDIAATFELKAHKHFINELSFGVYNTYARSNAFSITFRQNAVNSDKTEAVQTTLFKAIPFVSWNFKIF